MIVHRKWVVLRRSHDQRSFIVLIQMILSRTLYHSFSSPLLYTLFICVHLHASYYNLFTFIHNLYSQRNIIIVKHCWPAATLKSKAQFAVTATVVIISILFHEQRFLYVHINEQQHRHDLRVKSYYYYYVILYIVYSCHVRRWELGDRSQRPLT